MRACPPGGPAKVTGNSVLAGYDYMHCEMPSLPVRQLDSEESP